MKGGRASILGLSTQGRKAKPVAPRAILAYWGFTLTLALCSGVAVCAETLTIGLQGNAYPTGIAYWPERKLVLFGTYSGSIYGMQEDGKRIEKLADVAAHDCARVMRIRVDQSRNRLWVMSAAGICVYNLQSLQLIKHLPLGDMSRHRLANGLTDIALDIQGNAYAIDTGIDPIVYRIDALKFAVAIWNKAAPPRDAGVISPGQFPLNAVAVTPHGQHLLYVNAYDGTLHALDLSSRKQTTVAIQSKLYAVNGLIAAPSAASARGIDLYVLSASNDSVTVIALEGDLKVARARIFATKHLDQPLAGTWVRDALFVTNSQLLRHPEIFNEDRNASPPFSIIRMGAAYFSEQAKNPIVDSVLRQ